MPTIHDRAVVACKTTILTCVDWRIHRVGLQNFVGQVYWPADVRTEPGAAHALVRDVVRRDCLLADLLMLVGAHSAETLFLLSHTDCAKYGGREAFPNADEEYKALWTDLIAAKTIIMQYPTLGMNLDVKLGIIRTGTSEVLHF